MTIKKILKDAKEELEIFKRLKFESVTMGYIEHLVKTLQIANNERLDNE